MGISLYVYKVAMTNDKIFTTIDTWGLYHWLDKEIFNSNNISYGSFSDAHDLLCKMGTNIFMYTCNPFISFATWCISKEKVRELYSEVYMFECFIDMIPTKEDDPFWTLGRIVDAICVAYKEGGWIRAS